MEVNQVDQALRYLAEVSGRVALEFDAGVNGPDLRMTIMATIYEDGGRRVEVGYGVEVPATDLNTGLAAAHALMRGASAIHKREHGRPLCWQ